MAASAQNPRMPTDAYRDPRCSGTLSRRALLRFGLAGLGLPALLRLEAEARSAGLDCTGKSVIVLWLWGGPSHMDTFDLKPDAPSEFRGEFRPISTTVPGIEICEHLPLLARQAHRFAIIRSVHHDSPGHVNSTHTMLTGYPGELVETPPYESAYPDFWSVAQKALGPRRIDVPQHVALPALRYPGGAYLGNDFQAFQVGADPSDPSFRVPNLGVDVDVEARIHGRVNLLDRIDRFRRDLDAAGSMQAMDTFNRKAVSILSSTAARDAFDLDREDPRVRDRYGRHAVGQRCLLARRLVEAGARLVTIDFPCVPGQKAFSWDDHASVWNIFEQMRIRLPVLDQVASALIEDLHMRGLDREVLVIVMGEMSHTPRISYHQGQPGREHWARSMSLLVSGGGLRMGQVIGSTDSTGEAPKEHPLTPNDLLATWYHALGVPLDLQFRDRAGRPVPILPQGEPIRELAGLPRA